LPVLLLPLLPLLSLLPPLSQRSEAKRSEAKRREAMQKQNKAERWLEFPDFRQRRCVEPASLSSGGAWSLPELRADILELA